MALFELTPLNLRVRRSEDKAEVWFERAGDLPLKEGDVVIIAARVHETKRSGGYHRGTEEHPVSRGIAFQLDIAETFLLGVRGQ